MKVVALGQALIHGPVTWSAALRALCRDADAVVCNFEGCLPAAGAWPMKRKTLHAAHPEALAMLADLGVTHLALGNNHVWDFGHAGILATRAAIADAGFAVSGAGVDLAEAGRAGCRNGVAVLSVDLGPTPDWAMADAGPGVNALRLHRSLGLPAGDIDTLARLAEASGEAERQRRREAIGYDAATQGARFYGLPLEPRDRVEEIWTPDPQDMARILRDVAEAVQRAAVVLVCLHYHHWAPDWAAPPGWLAPLGAALLGAGAQGVVATGPPVAYPAEVRAGQILAPGMGNLVFHTARAARYRKLGIPIETGQAAIFEGGRWRVEAVDVVLPLSGQAPPRGI
ncbi:MAG: hypothetical protein EP318_07495 [Rhodobacteraceae bacterium]|nr:MAG: hypothetical protein EP318_07495 [Paracoccaceae bacterium]